MDMQNCSQNVCQLTMLPLNLGIASFGNFTPVPSGNGVGLVELVLEAYISRLILKEQSNTSPSSRDSLIASSSDSLSSIVSKLL